MDNFIQLKKDNILRIGIKTSDGVETGEHLEFDLEDIELPLKLNDCNELHKKNIKALQKQFAEIEKISETKNNAILSLKKEKQLKAFRDFYKKESEALDLFIGEGGTTKLLNGRKPYYTMFDDFMEVLEPILPLIKQNVSDIQEKIKSKYSVKDDDILE